MEKMDCNELSRELGRLLVGRRETVGVAESITCGRLAAAIGATSGASAYLRGGITAYVLDAKVSLLGVDRGHAAEVDCVSPRVACEMALGALHCFGADWSVATTGYAEPYAAGGFPDPGGYISVARRTTEGTADGPQVRFYEAHHERVTVPLHQRLAEGAEESRVFCQNWVAERALKAMVEVISRAG
jgi:PncC family amidohydrolase